MSTRDTYVPDPQLERQKEALILSWVERGVPIKQETIAAFQKVHRELFTLPEFREYAYTDRPLPILGGQTISQPITVLLMLDMLDIHPGQNILEIGAGSGYNAAMLGTLVGQKGSVISTEIIPELVDFAKNNLEKASIDTVKVMHVDGSKGYKKKAPYDRIISTAGAPRIPLALIEQLAEGGILLIPADANGYYQKMFKITKKKGGISIQEFGEFQFVPLTGEYGK